MGKRRNRNKQRKKQDMHTPYATTARCYSHRVQPVFELKSGAVIHGGAVLTVERALEAGTLTPSLVIDASHSFNPKIHNPVKANEQATKLLPREVWAPKLQCEPAVLHVDWPDGGVPMQLGTDWWQALADYVRTAEGDIVVSCMGGHGRTGVLLVILGVLLGGVPEGECPVTFVRNVYCDQAVETVAQVKYIERITGRAVSAQPSDVFTPRYTPPSPYSNSALPKWVRPTDDEVFAEAEKEPKSTRYTGNLQITEYEDGSRTVYNRMSGSTTHYPAKE